ncbi:MAG TPA: ABC transporter substrate-binding protein [Acidisoma sp.]|jgi:phospholipid transport system substrate-binding protein|uniref:MlaC/ttg2D family ABC transporter substrate-binding protein n=1 Tax=Acidisoma sp. TaxID=1872115 RepID=UPI002CF6519F|nr:ABC transporter substrate-binding protein [Acidisoma sp.]HTI00461.1 ABC transporter substrate-binding protein [Acidisoma sp.]
MLMRRRSVMTALAAALPIAGSLGLVTTAHADDVSTARSLIQSTGAKLLSVINSSAKDSAKQEQLRQLVYGSVDVDGVARFVLGRYWRVATPAQQADYMETFRQLLVYAVTAQASTFQGASMKVGQAAERDMGIVVDTAVTVPGKPETTVQWVVATIGGQPKIIDIIAEGTSLRITERNDYAGVISQHGGQVQPLLDAMHHQLARFKANATG